MEEWLGEMTNELMEKVHGRIRPKGQPGGLEVPLRIVWFQCVLLATRMVSWSKLREAPLRGAGGKGIMQVFANRLGVARAEATTNTETMGVKTARKMTGSKMQMKTMKNMMTSVEAMVRDDFSDATHGAHLRRAMERPAARRT